MRNAIMKLYPNRDNSALYIRSMGKMLRVTAIFTKNEDANRHTAKPGNTDAVVAVSGSLVILADVHDKGTKL